MKVWQGSNCKGERPAGYVSIHDKGGQVERTLYIEDDDGNAVTLRNEQIGELYKAIKPTLAG